MADSINTCNGSFRARIDLDELCKLPLRNFKKLVKLMRDAAYENQDSLATLRTHLQEQVKTTKSACAIARQEYTNGWKLPIDNSTRKENRRLKNALKRAKAAYKKAVAMQTAFGGEGGG